MKYGINTLMFAATFDDAETHVFGKIRDLGFDVVEIALEKKGDLDYRLTVKELEKNGLACSSICGLFGGQPFIHWQQFHTDSLVIAHQTIRACTSRAISIL